MLLIAEDFFTWRQMEKGSNLISSASIQKFVDDTNDRVTEIVFRVDLDVVRSQNECAIPKKFN
jgi:hypothetical protein